MAPVGFADVIIPSPYYEAEPTTRCFSPVLHKPVVCASWFLEDSHCPPELVEVNMDLKPHVTNTEDRKALLPIPLCCLLPARNI